MKKFEKIKTVVFPVAGIGTRFLPATKSVAKELIPILNRPLIEYAVEEAQSCGFEKFVFVLNPDARLQNNTVEELDKVSNEVKNFAILAPTLINNGLKEGFGLTKNYGTYKSNTDPNTSEFFEVDYIQGCALLLDKKELIDIGFFDENIFMYFDDIDLCKRIKNSKKKIYISKNAKIEHLGAKAVNDKFFNEVEF